jgi:hypothetical protein
MRNSDTNFLVRERIIEGLSPSLGRVDTREIFAAWLLSTILGLPAINLSISFLPSPKAAPGVLAIAFQ